LPLAVGVAVYTAFLFGQAEGRDLWQSSVLPIHLIIQALMVGSGVFLVLGLFMALPGDLVQLGALTFTASLIIDVIVTLFGEFGMPHASEVAARAAHAISHGRFKNHFWWGSLALGHAVPLALLLSGQPILGALAAILAIVGLYLFEYAFVTAPQEISNS
jgi:formate-dependent nitrite reductase membrane component NrfD